MDDQAVALGIAGSGPVAVAARGVLRWPRADRTLRWWVVEERLRRPDREAAVRDDRVGHAPVAESRLRLGGGDVVGRSFAYPDGPEPAVGLEIRNETASPVAVVVVVDGLDVSMDRRAAERAEAPTVEDLAERLGDAKGGAGAVVAHVVPLPHRQSVRVWTGGREPPPLERVVAGWTVQATRGVRIEHPAAGTAWEVDRRLLVLDGEAGEAGAAARLGALIRLGWFDAAVPESDAVLAMRRRNGDFGTVESTVDAVDGLAAWCRAGLPAEHFEPLLEPLAAAAHWLVRNAAGESGVAGALAAARHALVMGGQPDAARAVPAVADPGPAPGDHPGRRVRRLLDGLVDAALEDGDPVVSVAAGWTGEWANVGVEVHGAPTPAGRLSWALRWHGEHPALLWELEPWPDAGAPLALRAPALDPAWSSTEASGDALLAAPRRPAAGRP